MTAFHEFKYKKKSVRLWGFSSEDAFIKCIKKANTFYEIELLEYINFVLKYKDGAIIDVGTNVGNHSVFFGKFMNRSIICFEPNPVLHAIIHNNLEYNGVTRYQLFPIGLGEKVETSVLVGQQEKNIGSSKLKKTPSGGIAIQPLDDIPLPCNEKVAAIKVDIEGMEPEMLKGSRKVLEMHKPELFLEVIDDVMMEKLKEVLYPLGYVKIYSQGNCPPVWHFSHRSRLSTRDRLRLFCFASVNRIRRSVIDFLVEGKTLKLPRKYLKSLVKRLPKRS